MQASNLVKHFLDIAKYHSVSYMCMAVRIGQCLQDMGVRVTAALSVNPLRVRLEPYSDAGV